MKAFFSNGSPCSIVECSERVIPNESMVKVLIDLMERNIFSQGGDELWAEEGRYVFG